MIVEEAVLKPCNKATYWIAMAAGIAAREATCRANRNPAAEQKLHGEGAGIGLGTDCALKIADWVRAGNRSRPS